jgi:hypothetical protein
VVLCLLCGSIASGYRLRAKKDPVLVSQKWSVYRGSSTETLTQFSVEAPRYLIVSMVGLQTISGNRIEAQWRAGARFRFDTASRN